MTNPETRARAFAAAASLALLLAAPAVTAQRLAPSPARATSEALGLMGTPFRLVTYEMGRAATSRTVGDGARRLPVLPRRAEAAPLLFLNVHDDENTSVSAALLALRSVRARVVELRHTGQRLLTFGPERFVADPNRMFTDAGAEATLARNGRTDARALAALRAFADTLLARAGAADARVVVALHNNTPDAYSARSYLPGADYERDAAAVHLAPGADADDFFYLTDRRLFDALAAEGFNVVLQSEATVADDGSLSVLAGRRGQAYVNVEAQHGHVAEQRRMIDALVRVLRRTGLAVP